MAKCSMALFLGDMVPEPSCMTEWAKVLMWLAVVLDLTGVTQALDEIETHFLRPVHLEPGPDFASLPLPCVIHLRRFRNRPLFICN